MACHQRSVTRSAPPEVMVHAGKVNKRATVSHGLCSEMSWVGLPALVLANFVIQGRLLNLSKL